MKPTDSAMKLARDITEGVEEPDIDFNELHLRIARAIDDAEARGVQRVLDAWPSDEDISAVFRTQYLLGGVKRNGFRMQGVVFIAEWLRSELERRVTEGE